MTIPSLSRDGGARLGGAFHFSGSLYTSPVMLLGPLLLASQAAAVLHQEPFTLETSAEVVARVKASCTECDWGRKGREAVAVELLLDGAYAQHLFVTGDAGPTEQALGLGRLAAGPHRLTLRVDRKHSARAFGPRAAALPGVVVTEVAVVASPPESESGRLLAHAPILELRPNSLGRFTDLPLLTWVETDDLGAGRLRHRYSVVFSNEDGGTPPDRLLATWGRLTDLEFVYAVELDADGRIAAARYQGKDHQILDFAGRREGSRPVLHVVTDNNMVSDRGRRTLRVAPAPIAFALQATSREAVMDAHAWTYAMSVGEARREGRVRVDAPLGSKKVSDPRRYVTLEACATTEDATVAFSAGLRGKGGAVRWFDSDGGLPRFRIGRRATEFPNGCFRGAVALPPEARAEDVVALRLRAFTRAPGKDEARLPPGSGRARLELVNSLFFLGPDDRPAPSLFQWRGSVELAPEGPPHELKIRD